jgi:hypothetical protein
MWALLRPCAATHRTVGSEPDTTSSRDESGYQKISSPSTGWVTKGRKISCSQLLPVRGGPTTKNDGTERSSWTVGCLPTQAAVELLLCWQASPVAARPVTSIVRRSSFISPRARRFKIVTAFTDSRLTDLPLYRRRVANVQLG